MDLPASTLQELRLKALARMLSDLSFSPQFLKLSHSLILRLNLIMEFSLTQNQLCNQHRPVV